MRRVWVAVARAVMVVAFAATIPVVLGVSHGNRIVWTVCLAALPFFWVAVGYHLWRRICPLAVAGQLAQLFGRAGTRRMGRWMSKHYLLVQLAIMVVTLSLRLVTTNGSAVWLAGFLGAVVLLAIATSFVYGGKTWCNFLCPVGMVEKIYTEPAGAEGASSQCETCVACKKHCPDIDLEQAYWKEAREAPRRIAYFAWPGVVVGFYTYFYLVRGTWDYYFSAAWTYERDLPAQAFGPGFTFAPDVPRIVAAPLTLVVFGAASFVVFALIEKALLAARRAGARDRAGIAARVRHGMLAFSGLVAFNAFYGFAGQPTLLRLPHAIVSAWGIVVVVASTAMFLRRIAARPVKARMVRLRVRAA
jgi:hypothetical protein